MSTVQAQNRRQQILHTATGLFAEHGFHGVSVHDIGAACGISGPAIYKHFSGKDAILTGALTAISDQLLHTGRRRAAQAGDHQASLSALIDWHIEFALGNPAYIIAQEREWSNLDDDGRAGVRQRQLAYIEIWVATVRALRPEWDQPQARAAVHATFGLLNSTPHSARISKTRMRTLLAAMAHSALLAGHHAPAAHPG